MLVIGNCPHFPFQLLVPDLIAMFVTIGITLATAFTLGAGSLEAGDEANVDIISQPEEVKGPQTSPEAGALQAMASK